MFTRIYFLFVLCYFEKVLSNPTNDLGVAERKWCDDVLGCLTIDHTWYTPTRPINVLPDTRKKINTRFYLHTRDAPNEGIEYIVDADDLTSLDLSPFNHAKPTKFISHGFIDKGTTPWLTKLALALLSYEDCNVFRIDWGDGSMPMYDQATANTRVVGLEIGHIVNTLIHQRGLDPSLVHCIGHSLGAHVCGYGGEQVPGMGRISGLDPAGPYFTQTPPHVRLDETDALFVDNIHTDGSSIFLMGYGTKQPMGNVDIYPNGGQNQPGCDPVSIAIELIKPSDVNSSLMDAFACSHLRSIKYFLEATQNSPSCQWIAQNCKDYDLFENGTCFRCNDDNSGCTYLGPRGDIYTYKNRVNTLFYLDTNNRSPFCMQQYVIRILTADPKEAEKWVMGKIFVTLYGDTGKSTKKIQITKSHEKIYHGEIKGFLLVSETDVIIPTQIQLKWEYDDNMINPGTYCWGLICNRSLYIQTVEVSSISHYSQKERSKLEFVGCGSGKSITEIKDGKTVTLKASSNCIPVN